MDAGRAEIAVRPRDEVEPAVAVEIAEGRPRDHVQFLAVMVEDGTQPLRLLVSTAGLAQEQAVGAGHVEVGPAIAVEVRDGDAVAEQVRGQADLGGDVLELEVALVAKEAGAEDLPAAAHDRVLQHEEIEQAVAVEVEDADVPAIVERVGAGARGLGNLDELAGAVVAEELAALGAVGLAPLLGRRLVPAIAAHVQVQVAVVVQVHEDGAAAVRRELQRRPRVVRELAAGGLAQQRVERRPLQAVDLGVAVGERAQEDVGPAVAVEVAPGDRVREHAVQQRVQPDLRRGIDEAKRPRRGTAGPEGAGQRDERQDEDG